MAVRKVLSDLSKTLEAYYTRVLESMDELNRVSINNLLQRVAFALRPIRNLAYVYEFITSAF